MARKRKGRPGTVIGIREKKEDVVGGKKLGPLPKFGRKSERKKKFFPEAKQVREEGGESSASATWPDERTDIRQLAQEKDQEAIGGQILDRASS